MCNYSSQSNFYICLQVIYNYNIVVSIPYMLFLLYMYTMKRRKMSIEQRNFILLR